MMQKLEPRTTGLKPTKIGHVDRVTMELGPDRFNSYSRKNFGSNTDFVKLLLLKFHIGEETGSCCVVAFSSLC